MRRKAAFSVLALAVLIGAVPRIAAASPVVTETGAAVTAGANVLATGEERAILTTGPTSIECSKYSMTGQVAINTGTNIEGTIESASFANTSEEDFSSNVGPVKVTIPGLTGAGGTQHWCIQSNMEFGIGKGQIIRTAAAAAVANSHLSFTSQTSRSGEHRSADTGEPGPFLSPTP
jgi:hypothetical protein